MKTNLVLTGNTETLDKEYNNILSGEWCLQNKNFKNKIAICKLLMSREKNISHAESKLLFACLNLSILEKIIKK